MGYEWRLPKFTSKSFAEKPDTKKDKPIINEKSDDLVVTSMIHGGVRAELSNGAVIKKRSSGSIGVRKPDGTFISKGSSGSIDVRTPSGTSIYGSAGDTAIGKAAEGAGNAVMLGGAGGAVGGAGAGGAAGFLAPTGVGIALCILFLAPLIAAGPIGIVAAVAIGLVAGVSASLASSPVTVPVGAAAGGIAGGAVGGVAGAVVGAPALAIKGVMEHNTVQKELKFVEKLEARVDKKVAEGGLTSPKSYRDSLADKSGSISRA